MGGLSITHILILLVIAVLLLGKGKVSGLMGDVASGIKAFKKNMADDTHDASMSQPSQKIAQDDTVKPTPTRDPAAHG
jgi:sec-independent protein translocase protein TatA